MPEMHLKQLEFTYSACGPFKRNKEKIQESAEELYKPIIRRSYKRRVYFSFKDNVWGKVSESYNNSF